ncbi:hypothetical protein ACFL46_02600 [Candidatus Neomarinimicrobiota bacterium]
MKLFPAQIEGNPPSNAEKEAITRIAGRIIKSGLVTPAVFFLEIVKPFSLLSSHALVFFGPIITAFVRQDKYYRATELLEDPKNVEFLLSEIERLDHQIKSKKNPKR